MGEQRRLRFVFKWLPTTSQEALEMARAWIF
jgi:hypothetical protein